MAEDMQGKSVLAYIESELSSAWQRKGSFETRAFSIITADIAVTGLFFALQKATVGEGFAYEGCWRRVFFIAIISIILSIVLAASSAFPLNYPIPSDAALDLLYGNIAADNDTDQRHEIIEARVHQLKQTQRSNRTKGRLVLSAFLAFGVGMASLVTLFAFLTVHTS